MQIDNLLFCIALDELAIASTTVQTLDAQIGVFGPESLDRLAHSLDGAEGPKPVGLSASDPAAISGIGDAALFDVPLLDGTDDVHRELAVALECARPVDWDLFARGQLPCDRGDHHLTHFIVFVCLGVDVLHSAETGVCGGAVVKVSGELDDVKPELLYLELFGEKVEVEEWADVFFILGRADRSRIQPAYEEFEWVVILIWEAVGLVAPLLLLFLFVISVED